MIPLSEAHGENGTDYGLIQNVMNNEIRKKITVIASAKMSVDTSANDVNQNYSCSLWLNDDVSNAVNVTWSYNANYIQVSHNQIKFTI